VMTLSRPHSCDFRAVIELEAECRRTHQRPPPLRHHLQDIWRAMVWFNLDLQPAERCDCCLCKHLDSFSSVLTASADQGLLRLRPCTGTRSTRHDERWKLHAADAASGNIILGSKIGMRRSDAAGQKKRGSPVL
jgi:hypothetical protein